MNAGRKFTIRQVLFWTRREILTFALIGTIPTVLYQVLGWHWIAIPWLPIALVGTAVAFLVGFKNNASYGRMWEARMAWGSIVNSSRTWGIMAKDYVCNLTAHEPVQAMELHAIHQRLMYRQVAWLTALRYQLRVPKAWESLEQPHAKEYRKLYSVPEWEVDMSEVITPFLSEADMAFVAAKKNRATQLLSLQSEDLRELRKRGLLDAYPYVEMMGLVQNLYDQQGKCERIKNFPYPRQFATFNVYFIWLFIVLVPLGMLQEVDSKLGEPFVWMTIPFTMIVAWVFHTMEKIGVATENPFEGGANDIPMANLSRTIEIDLREMLGETELPRSRFAKRKPKD